MTKTDFLKFRQKYFKSQADMSRQTNIPVSTLSNLERGHTVPSRPMLWGMALHIKILEGGNGAE